jgi:hypothetical protein
MTGSVNANVEPCPTCDSTQILPPVHFADALRYSEPQAGAAWPAAEMPGGTQLVRLT